MTRRQTPSCAFKPAKLRNGGNNGGTDDNGLPVLDTPGYIRLFSSYKPSLVEGDYQITVDQTVDVPGQGSYKIRNTDPSAPDTELPQTFTIGGPRFSIEAKDIHSTYPPEGHSEDPKILPHIVLTDPHLPWLRHVPETDDGININPWLAVLVFDPAELAVDSGILQKGAFKQAKTMEVPLTLQDLVGLPNVGYPFDPSMEPNLDLTQSTKAIFIKPALFTTLYDVQDGRINLDRYKYLAHVRNVDGSGGVIPGLAGENGVYSVVVSHRTGPLLTNGTPENVMCHLVSIDGFDRVKMSASTNYVAMVSLHSWQYRCLPPGMNLADQLRYIGTDGMGMLRPLNYGKAPDPALAQRLSNGYSMVRHRLPTGENTVAFFRGPLSPVPVPYPLLSTRLDASFDYGAWPLESFNSNDYQILDSMLGIMDISYATAWQLGRAMAMADRTFANALVNLRGEAYTMALAEAKKELLTSKSSYKSRVDVASSLLDLANAIGDVKNMHYLEENHERRWKPTFGTRTDLSMNSEFMQTLFNKNLSVSMKLLAPKKLGDLADESFDPQSSASWPIIVNWLLDRLKLADLPAIYLINHPSNVPPESMRFFHIDLNWIAAQIDGALSIGNQVSRPPEASEAWFRQVSFDRVRQEVKICFAEYLAASTEATAICPNGGFFTRSLVVKMFPDLIIAGTNANTQVLSTINLAQDTLLTLIRRTSTAGPVSGPAITITQPPHQQRFVIGAALSAQSLIIGHTSVYTVEGAAPVDWGPIGDEETWERGDTSKPPIYDWNTRLLNMSNLAADVLQTLNNDMKTGWIQTSVLPSAAMAIQLNDKLYQLCFQEPEKPEEWTSQLYGYFLLQNASDTLPKHEAGTEKKTSDEPSRHTAPKKGLRRLAGIPGGKMGLSLCKDPGHCHNIVSGQVSRCSWSRLRLRTSPPLCARTRPSDACRHPRQTRKISPARSSSPFLPI